MVNNDEFVLRLKQLMTYLDVSASTFAEKTGVQRSGLSHLLSGRNRPSLDFVMKIIETYPEVDLYWLLNGKGNLIGETSTGEATPLLSDSTPDVSTSNDDTTTHDLFTTAPAAVHDTKFQNRDIDLKLTKPGKTIERVMIFYSDGTFDDYRNP